MKNARMLFLLICICVITVTANQQGMAGDRGITNTSSSPYVKLRSVDIDDVTWTDGFWADMVERNYKTNLPHMWYGILSRPEFSHAWTNFRIAAGLEKGVCKGTWWHDAGLYKWLEGVCHTYAQTRDPELDELMDKVIAVIGQAQQADGYISTPVTIGKGYMSHPPYDDTKLINTRELKRSKDKNRNDPEDPASAGDIRTGRFLDPHRHELYNMGHLMTTGCIHFRATGKTDLLNIAQKAADYLYTMFKDPPDSLAHFGFNPSYIMGSVEMYRTTSDPKYLELANSFLNMRGSKPGGDTNYQDHAPFRKAKELEGHAVTALYLCAGAADVYAETGDTSLMQTLERLWDNMVAKKMYVTGAVGSQRRGLSSSGKDVHEAFGREYELPNSFEQNGYSETCASIANAMWSFRMFGLTGEARYADVMERVLYNSLTTAIGLEGKTYFYQNYLRVDKSTPVVNPKYDKYRKIDSHRGGYVGFCCPASIVRSIAKMNGWAYGISDNSIWVNLYGANEFVTELNDGFKIKLIQETDYPWEEKIKIKIDMAEKKEFALMLRVPQWAQVATLRVNGEMYRDRLKPGTYEKVFRKWASGDVIDLDLQMPVQLVEADPRIEECRNQIAVQRGPIIYCLESPDLPGDIDIMDVVIPGDIQFDAKFIPDLLGGVTVLDGAAFVRKKSDRSNQLYRPLRGELQQQNIRLVPYYTWSNRGVSDMTVWMPLALR